MDSLHLETCHIRPIRPYSLTPFRRGSILNCPIVIRPKDGLVIKFHPLKVKARFKLQKGKEGSAFCSLGINTSPDKSPGKVTKASPQKASPPVKGKGNNNTKKRKRSLPEESPGQEEDRDNVDLIVEVVPVEEIAPKRGRKAPAVTASKTTTGGRKKVATNNNNTSKIEITKRPTKASKRKSLEQEKQEREDFELAKKLQKELNSSSEGDLLNNNNIITNGGVTRRMTRNSSVATSYSLRTTRSLSKVSLGSEEVHPVEDGEKEVEDTEEEIQTTKKTKKSPPRTTTSRAKKMNVLNPRTRNSKTVTRKTTPMVEKEEMAKSVSKNKETSNKRTTRSKGSHGSTK